MFLGVHLKGSALALYHSLCADGQVQFKILKKALLIKFECTKDGYKDKFRASKPEIEESFFSFAIRLSHLFDRWIEMSGIDKSYEDLRDLMLSEHILSAVSKDLSVFLRERDLKNSQEMVQHCEQYRLAHPTKCLARRADVGSVAMGGNKCTQSTPNYLYAQRAGHTPQRYSNNNTPVRFPYQTHMQGQPKQNTFTQQGQQVPRRGNPRQRGPFRGTGRGRGGVSDVSGVVCHECGGVGHFRRECGTFLKKMDQHKENAAVSMCVSEKVNAEVLCSVSSTKHGSLPICGGTVNGFQVSVLRDSGATTAGVRQALVREDQYLDKQQEVVTFGGNREVFPLAKVDVDTHFFSGSLICCVIQDPVADLILGNVTGVNPIPGLIMSDIQVAAAVETRAQKKDEKKKKSNMDVPFADLNMSKSELITLQEQDPALNKYHGMAKTGECVNLRNSSYSFSKEQGVLVRNFAKGEENVSQVVVPEQARKKVLFVAHDGLLAGHCGIRKTLGRVESRFWWPGISRDVQHYCRTCEICQKCKHNMLKFFHRKTEAACTSYSIDDFSGDVNCSRQVDEAQVRPEKIQFAAVGVLPVEENESEFSPISIIPTLSNKQKVEMQAVFQEFTPIVTTNPGGCTLDVVHGVNLAADKPVFLKQYPLPFSAQETIKKEIDYMLVLDVIEVHWLYRNFHFPWHPFLDPRIFGRIY